MSTAVRMKEKILLHSVVRECGDVEEIWVARLSRGPWKSYRIIHWSNFGHGHFRRSAQESALKIGSRYGWLIVDKVTMSERP
jgi:hypothetical protein